MIPIKKKAEETKEKVSKEEKTHSKIEQSKPIHNIIESIYGTNDPTQNCTNRPSYFKLPGPTITNEHTNEGKDTKKYIHLYPNVFLRV